MAGRFLYALLFSCLAVTAGRRARAWEIPLTVEEQGGKSGPRRVTCGVPLLVGQAKETSELRLATKSGGRLRALPAQFRVLARWWRADDSIRWVLVDFTSIRPNEKERFCLTNSKLKAATPKAKLTVEEKPGQIVVTTGPARFVIDRGRFTFLREASVDANGDGRFSREENLLATTADCGTVLEDTYGTPYFSSEGTRSVEVIEAGPLRVRVRARGMHRARGGKGYRHGMYSYDYIMDFYADSAEVYVDLIVGNNPPKSTGSPTFEDASLFLKLKGGATGCRIYGDAAHDAGLAAGASICLYQDSNGAETWKRCQGYNTERRDYWRYPEGKTASFRGYKLWRRAGGGEEEIASGDHARGTVHIFGERGGVVAHMRNFWRQFPKGVEVAADGTLRLALFPREYKVVHFLEDASAKGHEIALHFYGAGRKSAFAADPAAFAGIWDNQVFARPRLEHIAATGALADEGPFSVPTQGLDKKPNNRTAANNRRMLSTDGLYGNAYGWQVFGEKWRSCGGHSSRGARQPMNEDNYLYRWFVTGVRGWFENGDARSRQFRDVRCYRIDEVDPFSYKDWEAFRRANRSEDWTRRPQPKDAEIQKYSAGRYSRSTFWLPNPAHMTMDLVYDRYLLMGDVRSFENLRTIGAHGGYYAAYRKPVVHRATGWSWRALFRYWELTGDKDAKRLMDAAIKNFKGMVDAGEISFPMSKDRKTGKETVNWWFTFVFSRAAAMTALHTRDPDALHICKRLAEKAVTMSRQLPKGYYSNDLAELYGVLYHLTGDEKYKKLGLAKDGGASLLRVTAGMKLPACAHWLLNQPPNPLK